MNKIAVVLGVAAVATLSGCKDPDYLKPRNAPVQDEVKQVEAVEHSVEPEVEDLPDPEETGCTCPAGAVHKEPCKCGAKDCACKVEEKRPTEAKPAVETTDYIVQRGDTLSGISKRYNVKMQAIRDLNPKMKNDVVQLGQKIKLPGKVNVGEQKPVDTKPVKTSAKGAVEAYKGATETYTVKEGDTIGKIAYGRGINIRQLKAMNNLTSNNIRVGQKLKVPAVKEAAPAAKPAEAAAPQPAAEEPTQLKIAPEKPAEVPVETVPEEAASVVEDAAVEAAPVVQEPTVDYTVQEGDDITGISIQYGVAAAKIRELNGLEDGEQVRPGQTIKLPANNQ